VSTDAPPDDVLLPWLDLFAILERSSTVLAFPGHLVHAIRTSNRLHPKFAIKATAMHETGNETREHVEELLPMLPS
jgi:hypothetical protein